MLLIGYCGTDLDVDGRKHVVLLWDDALDRFGEQEHLQL